jgi:Uma2 family endonuclease
MSTVSKLTANHLAGLREPGKRFELVRGELKVMSPAGGQRGRIAMRIGSMLEQHVRAHQLGQAFAAETGFLLSQNPDTVRAPDAAFVNAESYATLSEERGYLPIAPDLVVEVISPKRLLIRG